MRFRSERERDRRMSALPILARSSGHLLCSLVCIAASMVACGSDEAAGTFPYVGEPARALPTMAVATIRPEDIMGRKELRFGATPFLGDEGTRAAFSDIADGLALKLGIPVRFVVANGYQQLIDMTVRGEVDIVQLSPLSYVKAATQLPNLRLIASSTSFGTDSYSAFLVVRSDSEIESLADLLPAQRLGKGRPRVALVDRNSASGFLLPYHALRDAGIDPQRDLDLSFTGSHEASIKAVAAGLVDVAAVSSGTLNSVRRGEVLGPGNLRLLYKAGRLPYDAVCVSSSLSEEVARRVSAAFAALDTRTPEGRRALGASRGMTGWIATSPERYDRLRQSWEQVRTQQWSDWTRELAPGAKASTQTHGEP